MGGLCKTERMVNLGIDNLILKLRRVIYKKIFRPQYKNGRLA